MTHDFNPLNRVSILTGSGRGAVAVVAAQGTLATAVVDRCFAAANGRSLQKQPIDRICFGRWTDDAGLDEEVVVVRDADASVEVHCHGGAAAAGRILAAFQQAGCQRVDWLSWTQQEASSAVQAETLEALAASSTLRTAMILLDQYHGALDRAVEQLRDLLESNQYEAALNLMQLLLKRSRLGRHLTRPWVVTIAGLPNVGKSSLMNALTGYSRSIVFDQPGTTRDVLTAESAIGGWPVRLIDVAGARQAEDAIEAAGVELAKQQIVASDLLLWVIDASAIAPNQLADLEELATAQLSEVFEGAAPTSDRLVIVNKIDLLAASDEIDFNSAAPVSAELGRGIDVLLATVAARLVPEPPTDGAAVPFTLRQTDCLQRCQVALEQGHAGAALAALNCLIDG